MIARGGKKMFTEVVTVTPEIAMRLLENNADNRALRPRNIAKMVRDITNDRWEVNGETIIVSENGELNDGQNRLWAIIEADKPVEANVCFGAKRSTRMTVDMGDMRTAGNFLQMSGVPDANYMAAAIRQVYMYERGQYHTGGGQDEKYAPTKPEMLQYYLTHKKELDRAYRTVCNEKLAKAIGKGMAIAAYVVLHRLNPVKCDEFWTHAFNGANLDIDDPVLWFRSRMLERLGRVPDRSQKLELVLRYWNKWISGAKLKKHIAIEGKFPTPLS
jgi:hypothetical protein